MFEGQPQPQSLSRKVGTHRCSLPLCLPPVCLRRPVPLLPSATALSAAIPLADHTLDLFADVVVVRSQCTLSAPRDTAISIATATVAVSIISRRETAGGDCSVDEDVVIPSFLRLSRCAQLNTRRLWNADGQCSTQRFTLCLPSFCDVPLPSRASRRLMLQILPASLMTNPIVMMGHPVLVVLRQASCSTSQSLPPPSQDSLTPQRIRWRLVGGLLCVCSYYAPHVKGMYPAPHIHEHLATAY